MPRSTRVKKSKELPSTPAKPASSALNASKDKQKKLEKSKKTKKDPTKIHAVLPDGSSHVVTLMKNTTAGDIEKAMEMCWRDPADDDPAFEGYVNLPGIGKVTFWPRSPDVPPEEIARALSIWYGVDLTDTELIRNKM